MNYEDMIDGLGLSFEPTMFLLDCFEQLDSSTIDWTESAKVYGTLEGYLTALVHCLRISEEEAEKLMWLADDILVKGEEF